jgi:hypothetical protein
LNCSISKNKWTHCQRLKFEFKNIAGSLLVN